MGLLGRWRQRRRRAERQRDTEGLTLAAECGCDLRCFSMASVMGFLESCVNALVMGLDLKEASEQKNGYGVFEVF
jgi:hypothetical protein